MITGEATYKGCEMKSEICEQQEKMNSQNTPQWTRDVLETNELLPCLSILGKLGLTL